MSIAVGVAIWLSLSYPVCLMAGKAIRAGSSCGGTMHDSLEGDACVQDFRRLPLGL